MWEDYILIMRIKRGDTDAWEHLVDKYYDKIFAYCFRRTYGNRSLASDLTQDIFLKLIQVIPTYAYKGKFYNYLYTIAVNHCNAIVKKKKLEVVEFDERFLADKLETVENLLVRQEESQLIQTALNRLPDIQREALILRYYQDLSFKEISEITGVSINTALGRMRYAVINLRKIIEKNQIILTN